MNKQTGHLLIRECKCEGLTAIRRIAAHHEILLGTQLHVVTISIVEEVRKPIAYSSLRHISPTIWYSLAE
jgi:hypothetical protein